MEFEKHHFVKEVDRFFLNNLERKIKATKRCTESEALWLITMVREADKEVVELRQELEACSEVMVSYGA